MRPMLHRSLLCLILMSPLIANAQTAVEETNVAAEATATAPEATTAAPAAEAMADTAAPAGEIGAAPAGKGQVVFFREKKFAGAAINYKVREGEAELGKLSSGTYFVHVTEPGAHEYTVHSEAKDVLNLEVEAGETYYVLGGITMGFMAGRPNLSPSDATAYNGMASKLKPAKPIKK